MPSSIAQFSDNEVSDVIASTIVSGKTGVEKKLSVLSNGTNAVKLFAANEKGRVGQAARAGLQEQGLSMIATQASNGRYLALSQALSLILTESVTISNKGSFLSLADRYAPKMAELELAGKKYNKSGDKYSAQFGKYTSALVLINAVYQMVEAIQAQS